MRIAREEPITVRRDIGLRSCEPAAHNLCAPRSALSAARRQTDDPARPSETSGARTCRCSTFRHGATPERKFGLNVRFPSRRSLLYICIPAYDEAPTVGLLLWRIRKVFQEYPREYEIIVFNDGSTDATQE